MAVVKAAAATAAATAAAGMVVAVNGWASGSGVAMCWRYGLLNWLLGMPRNIAKGISYDTAAWRAFRPEAVRRARGANERAPLFVAHAAHLPGERVHGPRLLL